MATRVGEHGERFGLRDSAIPFGLLDATEILAGAMGDHALVRLYHRERPDIVHHVALKPMCMAPSRQGGRVPQVNAVAGLGWLFTAKDSSVLIPPRDRRTLAWLLGARTADDRAKP